MLGANIGMLADRAWLTEPTGTISASTDPCLLWEENASYGRTCALESGFRKFFAGDDITEAALNDPFWPTPEGPRPPLDGARRGVEALA